MIKIIIADKHQITRCGLLTILEQNNNFKVIAQAEHGRKAVELCEKLLPDIMIMGMSMPVLNGIEATRLIKSKNFRVNIIILSRHKEKHYVLEALKAGALGYLVLNSSSQEIIKAVEDVYLGRNYFSSSITDVIIDSFLSKSIENDSAAFRILSGRERAVLQLISEGFTTKAIAAKLSVSVKTIETQRKSIMDKLNLHSIAQLTKYAIQEGITDLNL